MTKEELDRANTESNEIKNALFDDFKKTWSDFKKAGTDLFLSAKAQQETKRQERKLQNETTAIKEFSNLENDFQNINLKIKLSQDNILMLATDKWIDENDAKIENKDVVFACFNQSNNLMYSDFGTPRIKNKHYYKTTDYLVYARAINRFANIIDRYVSKH